MTAGPVAIPSAQGAGHGQDHEGHHDAASVTSAGSAFAAGVVHFGWPMLLGRGVTILLVLGWLSWILNNTERTNHLCMIIYGRKVK